MAPFGMFLEVTVVWLIGIFYWGQIIYAAYFHRNNLNVFSKCS
jgi:hypothetical protein